MVYQPLEDSFLMQECVKELCPGKTVLDMGTGTGIQAITASEAGAETVTAADVDPRAVEEARKNIKARGVEVSVRKSDLFSNFSRDEKFDVIIFNPPYLPDDKNLPSEEDISGGKVGNELSIRFLEEAKHHLTDDGFIVLICSSISNPMETFAHAKSMEYDYEILEERRLNMETLYCVKFTHVH